MKKYILVGLLVILILGIALAPASLVRRALDPVPQADLLQPRGTIWQGQGNLLVQGNPLGTARWSLRPLSLLTLSPTADWQLDQTLADVRGDVEWSAGKVGVNANGNVQADAFNGALNAYQIFLTGVFELKDVHLQATPAARRLDAADGEIMWSGGRVRFALAGLLYEETLPPMVARLSNDPAPNATVFAQGDPTPLMHISEGIPGFIKIGITKRFTELVRRPWPGNDPAHRVVVQVEEQIL